MPNQEIPYKIYLEEKEMPRQWYNVRADMTNKPAPLLNPATLKPMTAEELGAVFCDELVQQELNDTDAWIDIPEEEKTISLLLAPWEEVEVQLQIQKTIHAPVEKGTCVGAVEYRLGSMILKRIPVVTEESVQRVDFLWCLRNVWSKYLGNVGIFEK